MSKQPEALRLADALADCETEYIANGAYGSAQGYYRTQNGVCDLDEAAAELRRLHSLNAEMLDALRNAEQLVQIAEEQARCMRQRIRLGWSEAGDDGRFGIAVKTDAAALRWQELDKQRNALIEVNRAAIAKAEAQQ